MYGEVTRSHPSAGVDLGTCHRVTTSGTCDGTAPDPARPWYRLPPTTYDRLSRSQDGGSPTGPGGEV